MSKDQAIGAAILVVCAVLAIGYLVTLIYPDWLCYIGLGAPAADVRFWLIAIPVIIAFTAILAIGAWIGWTMATTPAPKPIEEITADLEKEEKKTE